MAGTQRRLPDPFGSQLFPPKAQKLLMGYLGIRGCVVGQRVSRAWRAMLSKEVLQETKPVWLYVIFRKNRVSGHSRPSVNISFDGPVFWEKRVVYVYCCSCHFAEKHCEPLQSLCGSLAPRVQRVCLVDSPADYPFITDGFFNFLNDHLPNLEFLYLRQLDLENLNFPTVKKIARHPKLKKIIAHMCRKIDVLLEFGSLPQLLVVKGEIQGLKAFLGDAFPQHEDSEDDESLPRTSSSVSQPASPSLQALKAAGPKALNGAAGGDLKAVNGDRKAPTNGHGSSEQQNGSRH